MRFAYLLLVHKEPVQVAALVEALGENAVCFIHVDAKSDIIAFEQALKPYARRIHWASKRVEIHWGGFSMIEATATLIHDYLSIGPAADYVHLLSGQDFPLLSSLQIEAFFEKHVAARSNFMEYFSIPDGRWADNGLERFDYAWCIDEMGLEQAEKRVKQQVDCGLKREKLPEIACFYGGSQWWSLTHECVAYLAQRAQPGDPSYEFFRKVKIPDESFFQTLLLNSEWAPTIVNDNLRYIDWTSGPEYPKLLRESDRWKWQTARKLWGRKFDYVPRVDSSFCRTIETHSHNTVPAISVCMACYNEARFIGEALDSLVSQSFDDWECIVSDDASTDRTLEVVAAFNDPRIRIVRNSLHDHVHTLNRGLMWARGKYMVRMDADDRACPERLKMLFNFMERNPDVTACGEGMRFFGGRTGRYVPTELEHDEIVKALMSYNCLAFGIFRIDFMRRHHIAYDPAYPYAEDYKLWCDVAAAGGILNNLPLVQYEYRVSEKQKSQTKYELVMHDSHRIQHAFAHAMRQNRNKLI